MPGLERPVAFRPSLPILSYSNSERLKVRFCCKIVYEKSRCGGNDGGFGNNSGVGNGG